MKVFVESTTMSPLSVASPVPGARIENDIFFRHLTGPRQKKLAPIALGGILTTLYTTLTRRYSY